MDNKKCTNDLCIKHINNIISVYDLSGCDKWFLRQLRSCEIYCRLNPLSKYYKLLVPADIEFKMNYGNLKLITPCGLMAGLELNCGTAHDLGIQCDYHKGQIGDECAYKRCTKTDCPKYQAVQTDHCAMMDSNYLDYCKHYLPVLGHYKILVPEGVKFEMVYGGGLSGGDSGIQCTLETGDIENG